MSNTDIQAKPSLRWETGNQPKVGTRDTYVCMVIKRENGTTSVRPEFVEWFIDKWVFPIGHEEGWKVQKWLLETEPEKREEVAIKWLKIIAKPLVYLQDEARKEGCDLNGMMAIQLCKDGNWLQQLAEKGLREIESLSGDSSKGGGFGGER